MKKEIRLLLKNLNGRISPKDRIWIEEWINKIPENRAFYNKLKELKAAGTDLHTLQNLDVESAWEEVLAKVEDRKTVITLQTSRRKSFYRYAAVAAVAGICILLNFYYQPFASDFNSSSTVNSLSVETGDGKVEFIKTESTKQLFNSAGEAIASQNADTLIYKPILNSDAITYNTLNVPHGKMFTLKLGDGSSIRLNAGSRITYPIAFKSGEKRLITLRGEAYFNVSKREDQPFVINTQGVNVEVLGTSFNVNSYTENAEVTVALVEGSVKMYNEKSTQNPSVYLKPNQLGSFNIKAGSLQVADANIWEHIAWLEGRLIIREATFTEILQKLERKYNVTIINKNTSIKTDQFNASFDVETIDEVLEAFALDAPFKFTRTDTLITITNK